MPEDSHLVLRYSDKWDSLRFTAHGLYVRYGEDIWLIPPGVDHWTERLWSYRGPAEAWDADESGLYVENGGEIRRIPPDVCFWKDGLPVRLDFRWRWWRLMSGGFALGRQNDVIHVPFDAREPVTVMADGELMHYRHIVTPDGVYYEHEGICYLKNGEQMPQLVMEIKKSKAKASIHHYVWTAGNLGLFAIRAGVLRQIAPERPKWDDGRLLYEGNIDRLFATPHGLFLADRDLVYRVSLDQ